VAAIAAGDFSEIATGHRQDEIQELVASVNSMSAQLRGMQHTIRQSERARLLAQLAGGLAHQLRNAVTGTRMALQLHQRRCAANPADKSLSVALRQLALTETQVRGLLSLGRGERSQPVDCDPARIVEDVAGLVEPTCEHADVTLEIAPSPTAGFVRADVESLRAAILNLTTNAIEAAGPGGRVTLRTLARAGLVGVEVGDDGSGPPDHVAESLFEPFVTTKPEGVGLGLALARQVAVDHGGSLTWQRENGQTRFCLMLPATKSPRSGSPESVVTSEIQIPNSEIAVRLSSAAPDR
jgi:signal transduction histidine kinase